MKARFFPKASGVAAAKGFIGLEDPHSGAITITVHGAGASPSGAPGGADWTQYIQSSCYQHGNNHNKDFRDVQAAVGNDHHVDFAQNFHWFEIDWGTSEVSIRVDGKLVRRVSGTDNVPQQPLSVHLHARSVDYPSMLVANMSMFVQEFKYEPAGSQHR